MILDLSSLELPIRLRTGAPMSDEEFLKFSQENSPFRMEREANGEVIVMTPTGYGTGSMNRRVTQALAFGQTRTVVATCPIPAPALDSNGAVRSPDAAWVSYRRLEAISKAKLEGFAPLCPEFVIELTSPSDRKKTVEAKVLNEWIAQGTELAWLIEPDKRRVTIYRPGNKPEVLDDPTSVQGTGCVAGFELVMERVWGRA